MASEVFGALAAARPEFAGMSYDTLGLQGTAHERAARGAGGCAMMLAARAAGRRPGGVPAVLRSARAGHGVPWLLFTIVKMLVVFTVIMVGVAMLTLAERKISAWIQDRMARTASG